MLQNIPVTPFFRNLRNKAVMAKQEFSFLKYVVMPLWLIMDDFLEGDLKFSVQNLKINRDKWERNMKKYQKEE